MDHSQISSRPMASFYMNHQTSLNPSPFGSSSLSTASSYSSFFGSTSPSTKSHQVSFLPQSPSPFNSSASSFSSSASSTSSSFYSTQSPFSSFSNSSNFSSASSPFSNASPILSSSFASNSANCSPSGFGSGASSSSSSSSSSSPSSTNTSRMRYWKNRDYLRESPANQLKNRRDEVVARFRGIDLTDDDAEYGPDPGADDPAWSWEAMCNQEWDLSKSTPKKETPWYVVDPTLTWEEFLIYSEADRLAREQANPSTSARNATMRDPDDESIDDQEADPWLTRTEILIGPLINIDDPNTMLCGYCKQYSLEKITSTKLQCTYCEHHHYVKPNTTIIMLKQRMLESLNSHQATCSSNFSNYTLNEGNIVLICENCDNIYQISKEFSATSL